MSEKLEDISKIISQFIASNVESSNQPISGGLIEEKSQCCNASLEYTRGGLIMQYCSKCKKPHEEVLYK